MNGGNTMQCEEFLKVPVDVLNYDDIVDKVESFIDENRQMRITSVNPQVVVEVQQYPEILNYIQHATFRIPDGIGIVKASKMRHGNICDRITGIEVMYRLLDKANDLGESIFLYGAKPHVVEKTAENIQKQYPNIRIAGYIDGYTHLSEEEIVKEINYSKATFLFVALGFPLQEQWLFRNATELNANIIEDVGGSFDVISGEVKRAPEIFQTLNLEWLYRSLSQKGRLHRLFQLPLFLWKVKREKVD